MNVFRLFPYGLALGVVFLANCHLRMIRRRRFVEYHMPIFHSVSYTLRDNGISVHLNDFTEVHLRSDNRNVFTALNKFSDFRELKSGVRENSRHIGVDPPHNIE